jgi:hypothetical protein
MYNKKIRGPLVEGNKTLGQITRDVILPMDVRPGMWWFIAFGVSLVAALFGGYAIYMTVYKGIGTWGVNNSVGWGWEIVNFVWWIGIGHAGTAFSIFLLILRQKWRTSFLPHYFPLYIWAAYGLHFIFSPIPIPAVRYG